MSAAVYRKPSPAARAKPRHLESLEQRALIQWVQLNLKIYPDLELIFAVGNGGVRSKVEAGIMKAEGVKAGVCDLMLPVARKGFHGMFIELKVSNRKEASVSRSQIDFIERVRRRGYFADVAYGWDEARGMLEGYLKAEALCVQKFVGRDLHS